MRCPILVGRDEPVSLLAGAIGRLSAQGRGGALVLAGRRGSGRAGLSSTRAAAARAGVRAVTGRALPGGIGGLLGPVAELIVDVTRGLPAPGGEELAPYLAVLASVVPQWRGRGWSAPDEPVLVTAEAVLRVLGWATGVRACWWSWRICTGLMTPRWR